MAVSDRSGTVEGMEQEPDLMHGVVAVCADCGCEQILVPIDRSGGFCCTLCDAAVFLSETVCPTRGRRRLAPAAPDRTSRRHRVA
jgi:hypothetical protein